MANHESSTKEMSSARPAQLEPCHVRFSWLDADGQRSIDAQRAAKVIDLTRGSRVIASILRQQLVDLSAASAGAASGPLLNEVDAIDLVALMEASLDTLVDLAQYQLEDLTPPAPKGGVV